MKFSHLILLAEWLLDDKILKYLVPTSVTLLVFTLGLFATWIKSNIERRRGHRQLKSVFVAWIPNLEKPVNLLANSCKNFSDLLANSNELSTEPFKYNNLLAGKLAAMDLNLMIKTFINNSTGKLVEKNKNLYQVVSTLEFLNLIEAEITTKYQEHYLQTNELLKNWNNAFMQLSDQNVIVLKNADWKSAERIALDDQLQSQMLLWLHDMQSHPQNTVKTYNLLLLPYDQLLKQYFSTTNSPEEDVVELTKYLQNLLIIYRQWQVSHKGYEQIFDNYSKKLKDSYSKLQSGIGFFEEKSRINYICT